MEHTDIYHLHAEAFKALSNPLRIEAVELLHEGELCFSDLHEKVGGLKSTLSQNLSIMVNAGLLKVRKDSRCNYYSLRSAKIYRVCRLMREILISDLEERANILKEIIADR